MKRIFLLLIILSPLLAFGQNTWFRFYDYLANDQRDAKIESIGEDYFLFLFGVRPNNQPSKVTANGVVRTDHNLQEKWKSYLIYPPIAKADSMFYHPKAMVISKDTSSYALSSMHTETFPPTLRSKKVLVNKFDKNGVWQWNKVLTYDTLGLEGGINSIALGPDSLGVMVMGRSVYPDASFPVLFRLDENGEVLLTKLMEVPFKTKRYMDSSMPLVLMRDGTYAMAYTDEGPATASFDFVVKFDTLGQILKYFVNADSTNGKTGNMVAHPNGGLVYISSRSFPWLGSNIQLKEGMGVQMLDENLNLVWEDLYHDYSIAFGPIDQRSHPNNIEVFPNGNILCFFDNRTENGQLVCYSPTGERLWKRQIWINDNGNGFLAYIGSMDITADGDILLSGYTTLNSLLPRIYVMRMDSIGCLTSGCDTTYFNPATVFVSSSDIFPLDKKILIRPNPSSGQFWLDYTGESKELILDCMVRIYSLDGRLVAEKPFYPNVEITELINAPAGLYAAVLVRNGQILWSGRIVHQKE